MTAVLHTHTRRPEYDRHGWCGPTIRKCMGEAGAGVVHRHIHIVVPGGGVNLARNEWRKIKGQYLFNGFQLATVFRARLPKAIRAAGLTPPITPKKWVVQCQKVGRGLPAFKYLSRYLYRGVISNRNIISDDGTCVTFQYKDSTTDQLKTRKLRGEDFIALVLQHILPKGFRRSRD